MPVKDLPVDNITARFGADLVTEGSTLLPNLLLKYYKSLGISDQELVLLIQLIFLRNTERVFYPQAERISQGMTASCEQIKEMLASLIEKQLLDIEKRYVPELAEVQNSYSLAPLFEELSQFWAVEKQQNLLEMQKHIQYNRSSEFSKIHKAFEKEFGRLLAPGEVEQIRYWVDEAEIAQELILEALRRAILMGVQNVKYIDKILLQWQKHNLETMEAVLEFEAGQPQKVIKTTRTKKAPEKGEESNEDKFRLIHWGNMGGSA